MDAFTFLADWDLLYMQCCVSWVHNAAAEYHLAKALTEPLHKQGLLLLPFIQQELKKWVCPSIRPSIRTPLFKKLQKMLYDNKDAQ